MITHAIEEMLYKMGAVAPSVKTFGNNIDAKFSVSGDATKPGEVERYQLTVNPTKFPQAVASLVRLRDQNEIWRSNDLMNCSIMQLFISGALITGLGKEQGR